MWIDGCKVFVAEFNVIARIRKIITVCNIRKNMAFNFFILAGYPWEFIVFA